MARTETVRSTAPIVEAAVVDETSDASFTKWESFEKAGLIPSQIVCQAYRPAHRADMSCHSRVLLNVDAMLSHMAGDHGGGFVVKLRRSEGKPWKGWKDLKARGIECADFRCGVCEREVPMHPLHLAKHMNSHANGNRRVLAGGEFRITLSNTRPMPSESDAFTEVD